MFMKKFMLTFVALIFIGSTILTAQTAENKESENTKICCNGKMWQDIPDLTQEQTKKIEDLQIAHLKEVNQLRAQVAEKRAHLKTLQSADKVDNAAINKTIDEITAIQNDLMKKNEAHRQAVRNVLTDKQRVIFDAKHCGKMHGKGADCCGDKGGMKGKDCGQHNGQGTGNGCGHQQHGDKGCCKH